MLEPEADGLPLSGRGRCRPTGAATRSTPTPTATCGARAAGCVVLKRLSDAAADGDRDPGGDPRRRGQPRRPEQRPDRAQRSGPAARSCERALADARPRAGRRRRHRGARHRHRAGRPDRGAGARRRSTARRARRTRRCVDRLGQDQHRPPRGRRRRRRPASRWCWRCSTSEIPPPPALRRADPAHRLGDHAGRGAGELRPWPRRPARAGRASAAFGFSGTNAHVIVEEAAAVRRREPVARPRRSVAAAAVGARRGGAAARRPSALAEHLERRSPGWRDVAGHPGRREPVPAPAGRRRALRRRAPPIGSTAGSPASRSRRASRQRRPRAPPRVGVRVHGPGRRSTPAWAGASTSASPCSAPRSTTCDALLRAAPAASRSSTCCTATRRDAALGPPTRRTPSRRCSRSSARSAAAVALVGRRARRRSSGTSIGEYVAACVAGVLDPRRRRSSSSPPRPADGRAAAGGAMVAVFADEAPVRAAIAPYARRVAIAAVNGRRNVVDLGRAAPRSTPSSARLERRAYGHRRLQVSHAFHSPLMARWSTSCGRGDVRELPRPDGAVRVVRDRRGGGGRVGEPELLARPRAGDRALRMPRSTRSPPASTSSWRSVRSRRCSA